MQMNMNVVKNMLIKRLGNNNPMSTNLLGMISNGDYNGIEQFARNLAKEKGRDPDKLYNEYKNKIPFTN